MMEKIQKFGGAMFTPVMLFAFSGVMVGIGTLFTTQAIFGALAAPETMWYQCWNVVLQGAWTVFNQLPLLFAVSLPIGLAKKQHVEIRLYSIIYELLEDITDALAGKLEPEKREKVIGEAKILQIFELSKGPKICGCLVESGVVRVGAKARVRRNKELIYNGEVASLRRFHDDVKEVKAGLECGIRLDNFADFVEGDEIELYEIELKKATL